MNTNWKQEDVDRLAAMVADGMPQRSIAAAFGRSHTTIKRQIRRLRSLGEKAFGGAVTVRVDGAWSEDDREIARLMRGLGFSTGDIARALDRDAASVASRLCRLRLDTSDIDPIDFGVGTRRPWHHDEDILLAMLVDRGLKDDDIAAILKRTPSAVQSRKSRLGIVGIRYPSRVRAGASWRDCMCCRRQFKSEGIHNRLCVRCKETYC